MTNLSKCNYLILNSAYITCLTNFTNFREELKEKYEDRLSKELSGPTYDVISRIMKALVNRKVTVPGAFVGFVYYCYRMTCGNQTIL